MQLGGLLIVDKPPGMTSHDVVARIRKLADTRRVGHAGTLDPSATGVLVIGIGWSTRLLTFLSGNDKSYVATIRFGVATVTDDADGEPVTTTDASMLTDQDISAVLPRLCGAISQVPSAISAVRVAGEHAYTRVRAGEQVVLEPRDVTVARFDVTPLQRGGPPDEPPWAELDATVDVSAGTYVRALARDLGAAVGTGAHLRALRRTRSGPFAEADAVALDVLLSSGELGDRLLSPDQVVGRFLPTVDVDEDSAWRIRHGQRPDAYGTHRSALAVIGPDGALVAVADDTEDRVRLLAVVPSG